ncbi:MAG: restriction endonuclease subunit S [Bacteroidota bacterium]
MKEGWEIKTLGDLANIKGGKRVPKGYRLETEPTNHPYIRVTDFNDNGTVELSDIHYISNSVFEQIKNYTISTKDLYISIAGTIGKTGIIPNELEGANLTENACKLVFKTEVDPKFVYYFTQTDDFTQQAGLNTRVTAMPKLALSRLSTISFLFPKSLPEQQRIVQLLDEAFEKIDTFKANAERNLQNAKELFQSALTEEFKPRKGWESKTLNQISENLDSKRVPITKNVRNEGEIPYYGASGIVDYVADYLFDEDLLCISEDGANLLARTYPIAFSISGKTWVNNHAHVLRFKEMVSQRFVELYLNSIKLDDYVSGMAQPKLNQAMLNKIPVPLPSLTEQQTIVEHLDSLSARCKALEINYQKTIAQCDEMKKAVLVKAFNGEL